ncbi:MAG: segregation and condensation protein A [Gammaproteobacteria bacterium]|nr:segregation and condensation protein A [Gammaproteobacteria bacterium]
MSDQELSKEAHILQVMRKVLSSVARETFTKPGFKHPLTDDTIGDIRNCLGLIAAREQELAKEEGRSMNKRPQYKDDPNRPVVISINDIGMRKKESDE